MRKSQLIMSIIILILLVGNVSAQPRAKEQNDVRIASIMPVRLLLTKVDDTTSRIQLSTLQYQNLCQYGPLTADVNNPTINFSIPSDGACVQMDINDCGCQVGPCTCTISILKDGKPWRSWQGDCNTISQIVGSGKDCQLWYGGEYTLSIDMCPDGWVMVYCCDCP